MNRNCSILNCQQFGNLKHPGHVSRNPVVLFDPRLKGLWKFQSYVVSYTVPINTTLELYSVNVQ